MFCRVPQNNCKRFTKITSCFYFENRCGTTGCSLCALCWNYAETMIISILLALAAVLSAVFLALRSFFFKVCWLCSWTLFLLWVAPLSVYSSLFTTLFSVLKDPNLPEPHPPVISGPPFVGCGLQFIKNPKQFLDHARNKVHLTKLLLSVGSNIELL